MGIEWLPVGASAGSAESAALRRKIRPGIARPCRKQGETMSTHAKILNVDGREPARSSRTRALRHAGFEVREAGTGGEALTLASTEGPGLVLLADDLPDTSGFDVCRRLKASPPTAQIPVVLLSDALAPETDRIRSRRTAPTVTYPSRPNRAGW